jgi:hypothetical protein
MPFVGLVSDPRWEPPEDSPEPRRRWNRSWRVPWSLLIGVAVWWAVLLLVPVVDREIGALAGFLLLLLNVSFGCWHVQKWWSRQNDRGLRDYQS